MARLPATTRRFEGDASKDLSSLRVLLWGLAAVVVFALLAGCASPDAPDATGESASGQPFAVDEIAAPALPLTEPVLVLSDAEGDARVYSTERARTAGHEACGLAPQGEGPRCHETVDGPTVREGLPAPPELDLVSLSMQESANEVVFRIGVASITDDANQFVASAGTEGAYFLVYWESGSACQGQALFSVMPENGVVLVQGSAFRGNDICEPDPADPLQGRCSTALACVTGIEWSLEPGTPGNIVLHVPRAQMVMNEPGTMGNASVFVIRTTPSVPGGVIAPAPDLGMGQFGFDQRIHEYLVDETAPARFALTTRGAPHTWGQPAAVSTFEPVSGTPTEGDLFIERVEFSDDERNFTITTVLTELPEAPTDLGIWYQLVSPGKHAYYFGASGDGGEWVVDSAFRWLPNAQIPVNLNIIAEPGTPGRLILTIPRSDFPGAEAGSLMRAFYGSMLRGMNANDANGPFGPSFQIIEIAAGDSIVANPYRFRTNPSEAPVLPALEFSDVVGDVDPPQSVLADPTFRKGRFDISYLSVQVRPASRVRVDLAVTGLDQITVPRLFDGVLYGVGFQTERGPWMVALAQDGAGAPAAFCGPDIAFLTPDPRAPGGAAGITVPYTLTPTTGDAAGLISFDVPASCFGAESGTSALTIQRAAARTALLGGPEGSGFDIMDESLDPSGGRLVFPQAIATKPVWAEPFGVSNFWDILGIAVAILFAVISAMVVIQKRLRMKRYLVQLEDLADSHHDTPHPYAEALVALRGRLFADFLANRLTEGHFVMVEERLRGSLSSTRINCFGLAFYDLPPALMIRLQSLLADGRFSNEDHRVLTQFLGKLQIPEESRTAVSTQIDIWAGQDREATRLARVAHKRGKLWRRRPRESADVPEAETEPPA